MPSTQQLARQAFLDSKKTIGRKLKEVALALRIERVAEGPDPGAHLNKVYFGEGLHGVEAAARADTSANPHRISSPV
jgi:penicillin-binding protein 1A